MKEQLAISQPKTSESVKARILIVDDESECLKTLAVVLTMYGYAVSTYTNAEDALQEIVFKQSSDTPYDLLITDIEMPFMKGDELIDELRGLGIIIPTLVMTGYGDKELIVKLLRKGCDDYIDKPIAHTKLLTIIGNLLKRQEEKDRLQNRSETLTEIGTFAAEIVHDINNILCTTSGYADLAKGEINPDSKINIYLEKISQSSCRATKLTRQLLTISKKNTMEFKAQDLGTVIRGIQDILRAIISKRIKLQLHIQTNLPKIYADRVALERLLICVSAYARDSMRNQGRLTLEVKKVKIDDANQRFIANDNNYLCLTVTDTGCGMDQETLKQIFNPNFNRQRDQQKNGLGLSSVLKIMIAHSGMINVQSELGKGTKFLLYFPILAVSEKIKTQEKVI